MATLTLAFCEAAAPVIWLSACIPAKFEKAFPEFVSVLSADGVAPPSPKVTVTPVT